MQSISTSLRFCFVWTAAAAVLATVVLGCRGDAKDELTSRETLRGTPINYRPPECFPAEERDLFWEMDQVAGPHGLQSLDFDENGDGTIDDSERDAMRGRNTWLVWGAGNETFWGWLQEQGYGITDLLILLDSRERGTRFERTGLINQPGFMANETRFLGLYLDAAKPDGSAVLRAPHAYDAYGNGAAKETTYEANYASYGTKKEDCDAEPFTPWTTSEERETWPAAKKDADAYKDYIPDVVRGRLAQDGLDPKVYGYPSGIFGLRLWLNPDFFAKTRDAEKAREYWRERVDTAAPSYYTVPKINQDPKLVRPFRVSMSCGFCHIGPHPLSPPADPENPEWKNLSGIIGGQYWAPQPALGILLNRKHFLFHFLTSQAPGTVDTSLISTDQINNTNVINAVFDVPARLARAGTKATELQGPANLLLRSIEDGTPVQSAEDADEIFRRAEEAEEEILRNGGKADETQRKAIERAKRHFPMVLFPGEDSVGVSGALARVYLNIGLFGEQWNRVDNPVIGFTPQRPFSVATSRTNSVFWQVNENKRVGYLAAFFTLGTKKIVPKSTAPMPLEYAPGGRDELASDSDEDRKLGRNVFLDHCAICHSSKQPDGFELEFDLDRAMTGKWEVALAPSTPKYMLPADYREWDAFKKSAAYRDYVARLRALPELRVTGAEGRIDARDPFFEDNFLSNELRIPVTLVGTYSGRAMATNAMRGQVWDNFSSETFKRLRSVGPIEYYNPYLEVKADEYGINASYSDGRSEGGPGYFRPASLISLWATAPYFHNNALGIYTHDPGVASRLLAFDDGIRKLLWKEKRKPRPAKRDQAQDGSQQEARELDLDEKYPHPGDLRQDAFLTKDHPGFASDPGYIYRTPEDTWFEFAPAFIKPLFLGVLTGYLGWLGGHAVFSILSFWLWAGLVVLFGVGITRGRARHVGVLVLLLAVVAAVVLALTGAGGSDGGTALGAMMMLGLGGTALVSLPVWCIWAIVVGLGALGFWLLLTGREWRAFTKGVFAVLTLVSLCLGIHAYRWLNGYSNGIELGPIPRGTPVNLLMNIDPEKPGKLPAAILGLTRAILEIKQKDLTGDAAYLVFSEKAGPALMAASKVPDFVLDRGHWFGEHLSDDQDESDKLKEALIAFLKTL